MAIRRRKSAAYSGCKRARIAVHRPKGKREPGGRVVAATSAGAGGDYRGSLRRTSRPTRAPHSQLTFATDIALLPATPLINYLEAVTKSSEPEDNEQRRLH